MTSLLWFRRDLRRDDNPALIAAAARGPVLPVYIFDPAEAPGGAAAWWRRRSLQALAADLGFLHLAAGKPADILAALARRVGADMVFWNRRFLPEAEAADQALSARLGRDGIRTASFNASLLFPPGSLTTRGGSPFKVFTPFWNACLGQSVRTPQPAPACEILRLPEADALPAPPDPAWTRGWDTLWQPGEAGAKARWHGFLDAGPQAGLAAYAERRDFPALDGVSRLSPHLQWGEISPWRIWADVQNRQHLGPCPGAGKYLSELGWREFAYHLLHHAPNLPQQNWSARFDVFPWRDDPEGLKAWREGRTGFPIVDAAMRELWQTGWMHNRARMIAASFLTKDLQIDWRLGAAWFADTLLDADIAVNAASWQWVAGCGADAAPYFRIFNPTLQSRKYDPDGAYLRRWCPELKNLSVREVHDPPPHLRGRYPDPRLDHAAAREAALAAYRALSGRSVS